MPNDILVEWDDKYSVGIHVIDAQHKELINMTNNLYQGCLASEEEAKAYFLKTIRGTVNYVKEHFSAEEKLLEGIKYPDLLNHKNQHAAFVLKIIENVTSFQSGKKFTPNVFVRYLKDWILSHIAVMDKQYAEYVRNLIKNEDALLKPHKNLLYPPSRINFPAS